jgi:hypothetical protein
LAVSTRTEKEPAPSGLSVTTLAIASVSSIAAAVFIHKFWKGGAILGAGLTPVIVAIVSETLKKPTQAITSIRIERRDRSTVARRTPGSVPTPPPPELERADPFGIWEERNRPSRWDRLKGRPLKIALVTGVAAFAIGALLVTGTQLVLGDSGDGGGASRLIYVPGKQKSASDGTRTKTQTTETQPTQTAPPTVQQTPTDTVPPETTPTLPQTTPTAPPATTPPAATAPGPQTTPAPTTPAPIPAPVTPPGG